jgi:hypothetical protein
MTNRPGKRNLKLHSCVCAWQNLPPSPGLRTQGLTSVLGAYEANINRVYALTIFPPALANTTSLITEHTTRVHVENSEKVKSGHITDEELKLLVAARIGADADRRDKIIKAGGKPMQEMMQKEIAFGFAAMDEFLAGELANGADAWLSAQITGIWTAFEAMAEELWVTALNLHPRALTELGGQKQKRGGGDDKKIDLRFLQMYGYDLSSKMGDVLRKRYVFEKLEEMRQAYEEAFTDDGKPIIAVISDRRLDALALTRHVITHSAGIIDDQFLKRRADLPAAIIGNKGEPLPLDGQITSDLIRPAIELGWGLIDSVDTWLATH